MYVQCLYCTRMVRACGFRPPEEGRRLYSSSFENGTTGDIESIKGGGKTHGLASFISTLEFEDIPRKVVERTGELFADWAGSAVAGSAAVPVKALDRFAGSMGPVAGTCEVFASRRRTSPLFAALVNAASSHVAEQDDIHNASVLHPGTVVFPAVLAAAQETGASGREALTAVVAGYETGIRVGEYLGRSHYRIFHTTGTAGTLAAAAGVSRLLGLGTETTLHALGSAAPRRLASGNSW